MKKGLTNNDLAGLVSRVTQMMLGLSFEVVAQQVDKSFSRIAILPIVGGPPLSIAISADEDRCTTLSAALFQVDRDSVDASMINDGLGELLNMTAGQIKNSIGAELSLGLPTVLQANQVDLAGWKSVLLRSGTIELLLAISDGRYLVGGTDYATDFDGR